MRIKTTILTALIAAMLMSCTGTSIHPPMATLFITGAVERPGRYTMGDVNKLNLHDLIQEAGGLHFASPGTSGEITLIRKGHDKQTIRIDPVRLMREGSNSKLNIKLSDGDLIEIRRQYD